jgi:hypothetical protein
MDDQKFSNCKFLIISTICVICVQIDFFPKRLFPFHICIDFAANAALIKGGWRCYKDLAANAARR